MRSAIRNQTRVKYKNHLGTVDDVQVSHNGETLYTGEKIDKYSEAKHINAVIQNKMGKVYNEQMGVMYEYSSTLQHNGKPVLNEAALVWIRNDHQDEPDFIVRSVVPSINSTIYHLIKKET